MSVVVEEMRSAGDFYEFFAAIPDERWHVGAYYDSKDSTKCCALGHLGHAPKGAKVGRYSRAEEIALTSIICKNTSVGGIPSVNDGKCSKYQQSTPKARILACLQDAMNLPNLTPDVG